MALSGNNIGAALSADVIASVTDGALSSAEQALILSYGNFLGAAVVTEFQDNGSVLPGSFEDSVPLPIIGLGTLN